MATALRPTSNYHTTDPPELAVADHMQRRRSLAPNQLGAYIGDTAAGSADPYQAARNMGARPASAYASGGATAQNEWYPPPPPPGQYAQQPSGQSRPAASGSGRSKPGRDINSRHPGQREQREQHIGDFIIKKSLGKGTFSRVCLAEHRVTKQKFALKFIKTKSPQGGSNEKHSLRVEREIKLLSLLYHPNIVRIYDVVQHPKFTMIVMEHNSGGELLHHIRKRGRLHENEARGLFRQIVSAMDYTHRNCIIHRDLKMENIMLDHEGRIRIIDFGFANTFEWDKQLDTFCGSPFYAAPEMVNGIKYTGPEVDIWSMGVILFFLLCGRTPFEGESIKVIYDNISRGKFTLRSYVSKDAQDLLQRTLTVDPRKRITMKGIVEHPWINRDFDQPINNHLPPRPAVVLQPDEQLLKKMSLYKYRIDDTVAALARSDMALTPMVCIYHLLVESRKRKASRMARRSHANQIGGQGSDMDSISPEARPSSHNRHSYAPGYGEAPSPASRQRQQQQQQQHVPSHGSQVPYGMVGAAGRGSDPEHLPPFGASQYEPPRLRKGSTASGQLSVDSSLNLEASSPFLRDDDKRNSRSSRFFDRVRKSMPFLKTRRSQVMDDVPAFDQSSNNMDGRNRASFFQVPFRRFSAAPSAFSLNNDLQQPVHVPSHYPPPPPLPQTQPDGGRPMTASGAARPSLSPPAARPATSSGSGHRPHRHTDFGPAGQTSTHVEPHRKSEPPRDLPYDGSAEPSGRRNPRPLSVASGRQVTPLRLHPASSAQSNPPVPPAAGAQLPAALTSRGSAPTGVAVGPGSGSGGGSGGSKTGVRGIFNLRCTMLGPLHEIQSRIDGVLKSKAIVVRQMGDSMYSCDDQGMRFEIIVENVQGQLHTIKFKRLEGNWWAYKKLTVAISNDLQSTESTAR
ncbi:MAP/microtubule affinity-regulating kinase 4 [Coemansia brasiliensis]|uniref:non-specific serine/threonine protein kinase n=1 Tax=Coemansia brasiliensis TaxID=2650707 RepID=A0A9W8IGE9_9FUNG|nr:MAP/microtubule affinity-regulating kinase 4 [Coemansia brasiliensis]